MNRDELKKDLIRDEDIKLKPYRCTVGKLTLGVGRNLEDVGITKEEALFLLDGDINRVTAELDKHLPWWRQLSEVRQRVLANMCFQLGISRLLGFAKALSAVKEGDFDLAERELLSSRWATQTTNRARRLASLMRSG